MRGYLILVVSLVVAGSLATASPAAATGGEGEAWPAFTESSGCGALRMSPPHAESTGWLSRDSVLRGPAGAVFGRTVRDVQKDLVRWQIPGSSTELAVHPTMLPALEQVTATIKQRLEEGDRYPISSQSTFSAAARTIRGEVRTSRHTFGTAFDINATRNPHRRDNKLITDMPDWWVEAFLEAGFCWGGLWIGSKDTMHFAWQGPAFDSTSSLPLPQEPLTEASPFGSPAVSIAVAPQELPRTIATILTDADGNGAIDVVRLTISGDDVVVDVSVASRRHNACSARRSIAPKLSSAAESSIATGFGDWDGRGGQDLWLAQDHDGRLKLIVRWAFGGYTPETAALTEVPTPSSDAWISTADVNVDGALDLVVLDGASFAAWSVDPHTGATSQLLDRPNPFPTADQYMLGDQDLDNVPDLWSLDSGVVSVALAASDWTASSTRQVPTQVPASIVDTVIADYDGDGRGDLVVFDGNSKFVWLGNTRLPDGLPPSVWFEHPDPGCEDDESRWDKQELRFSTSGWVATGSYEWRTANGLAAGCDPEEDACAASTVTHSAFAEFLAWIAGLSPASGHTVHPAARALRAAGFETPCSIDDDVCWGRPMLRADISAQFGMFLAERRGDVPAPHRWVTTTPLPPRGDVFPQ